MALHLLLLRHAEAEEKKSGMVDFDRKLTQKGSAQCVNVGGQLKKTELRPDYLVSSPAARTMMTTTITLEAWGINIPEINYDESVYHGDETQLLQIIRQLKPEINCMILVGHNPTITGVADILVPNFKSSLDTCNLLWIEFETTTWNLVSNKNSTLKQLISPTKP
jgi:phosphohistidine phosphatase